MTTSVGVSPGWYPDPQDARQLRWFDGREWTTHVRAQEQSAITPTSPQAQYAAAPQYAAMPAGGCQQCGAAPAIAVKLRGHHGMLFMQRFLTYRGTWCRDCGANRFRFVQKDLMLKGWWGYISFFVTWVNIVQNLLVFGQFKRLGAPENRRAQPLAPGNSVFASPGFVVTVGLIGVLGYLALR